MTKDFDFDKIGKKTPYRVPEGFFDDMQQQVMQQVEKPRHRSLVIRRITYAVIGAAALVSAFVFIPRSADDVQSNQEMTSYNWVEELSDEELQSLDNFSENDIFMN